MINVFLIFYFSCHVFQRNIQLSAKKPLKIKNREVFYSSCKIMFCGDTRFWKNGDDILPVSMDLRMDSSTTSTPLPCLPFPFLFPPPFGDPSSAHANLVIDNSSSDGLRRGGKYGMFTRIVGSANSSGSRKNKVACLKAVSAEGATRTSRLNLTWLVKAFSCGVVIPSWLVTFWKALMPRMTQTRAGFDARLWMLDCQLRSPTS